MIGSAFSDVACVVFISGPGEALQVLGIRLLHTRREVIEQFLFIQHRLLIFCFISEDHGTQVDSWCLLALPLQLFNVHAEQSLPPVSLLRARIELFIVRVIVHILTDYRFVDRSERRLDCAAVVRCRDILSLPRLDPANCLERAAITVACANLLHLKEANLLPLLAADFMGTTQGTASRARVFTSLGDYLTHLDCLRVRWVKIVVLLGRDRSL